MSGELLNANKYEHLSVREIPVSGVNSLVKTSHADKLRSRNKMSTFSPLNAPSGIFAADGRFVDIEISSDDIHVIKNTTLQLEVTNGYTGSIQVVQVPYLISNVQIFIGSSQIEQIYNDHLYCETLLHNSDSTLRLIGSSLNMSVPSYSISGGTQRTSVYGAGSTMAASESRTWLIDIYSFINQSELFLPALKQRIKFRIYFQGPAGVYVSGSTGLTLDSASLLVMGVKFDNDVLQKLVNRYMRKPHFSRCLIRRYQSIQYGALDGTQKQNALTAISGTFSHVVFFLRKANPSASEQSDFYDVDQYTMLLSNGQPDGYINTKKEYVRSVVLDQLGFPSGACGIVENSSELTSQAKSIMVHSFSHKPLDCFETGNSLGSEFMNGLWQLQTTDGVANGSISGVLNVLAYQFAILSQQPDGSVTVLYQ